MFGWFNPPSPKFGSLDKAEPNSQFRGKYIHNQFIITKTIDQWEQKQLISWQLPWYNHSVNPHTVNWSVQHQTVMTLHFTPQFIHPVHSTRWMWSILSPIQTLWQIKHPVTVDLILQKHNRNREWTVMVRWNSSYRVSRFDTGNIKRSVVKVLSQFYPIPTVTTYFMQIIVMLSHKLLKWFPRSCTKNILHSFRLPIPNGVSCTSEHCSFRCATTQTSRSLPLLYVPIFPQHTVHNM
jgi:hypothetical protein